MYKFTRSIGNQVKNNGVSGWYNVIEFRSTDANQGYANVDAFIVPQWDESGECPALFAMTTTGEILATAFIDTNGDEGEQYYYWRVSLHEQFGQGARNTSLPSDVLARAAIQSFRFIVEADWETSGDPLDEVADQVRINRLFIPDNDILEAMPVAMLRSMSAACEANPKSIRKDDVVQALIDCRVDDYNPTTSRVIYDFGSKQCHSVLGDEESSCNRLDGMSHTFQESIARDAAHSIVKAMDTRLKELEAANINVDAVQIGVSANVREAALNSWLSSVAEKSVAALQRKAEDAELEAQLKADAFDRMAASLRTARGAVTIPPDAETVDICGEVFQRFGSPKAPAPIENYSTSFWRASQRVGTGAKTVVFNAADFTFAALNDRVISLVGPPGVGKTSIVVQVGAILGIPVTIVQFTRDKPVECLMGVDKIIDGSQRFVPGEISRALINAAEDPTVPHFIVLDEFDHSPAEVQSELHGVVEGRSFVMPNGEVVPNHGNVHFIVTRNTTGHGDTNGRHSAANVSDSAFNSRISVAFMVDYMLPEHEQTLLCILGLDAEESKSVVEFANKTRDSVRLVDEGKSYDGMAEPVCLRHLMAYARMRSMGRPVSKALAMTIISQLPARDRSVANELAIAAMGDKID